MRRHFKGSAALLGGILGLALTGCAAKPATTAVSGKTASPATTPGTASTGGTLPSAIGHNPPPGSAVPPGGPKIPAQFSGR